MLRLKKNKVMALMYSHGIPTRRELARRVGLSDNGLYDLLRGKYGLNADTLFAIARVLDCPVEELVEEVEPA
jgi:transcriptional regulator with XRE-family HTH domain